MSNNTLKRFTIGILFNIIGIGSKQIVEYSTQSNQIFCSTIKPYSFGHAAYQYKLIK